jgi:phosphate-selective porin OprO/OprP
MKKTCQWAAAVAAGLVSWTAPVASADDAESIAALKAQIEEMDQKLRILERNAELATEKNDAEFKKIPVVKASDKGLQVESKDGAYKFRLGGLLQVDNRTYIDGGDGGASDPLDDTFALRRVRPRLRGTLWEKLDFDFQPEFAGTVRILDAYGDWKILEDESLRFRFGQFKTPVGLERLQSASNVLFIERGLPTNLVPTRDIGLQLHGKAYDGVFTYGLGVFNGVNDGYDARGNLDTNDGYDIDGRLVVAPFKKTDIDFLQGLSIGVAGSWGTETGAVSNSSSDGRRIQYVSAGQNPFFRINDAGGTTFDGDRIRYNPQLTYYYGPFGLLSEYTVTQQEFARGGKQQTLINQAFTAQASYVLTGEDASYEGVKPAHPFSFGDGGWGAWELAARYGFLDVDSAAFDGDPATRLATVGSVSGANAWAVGLNWYLNTNFKFQLNFEQTYYNGGDGLVGDKPTENALLSRLQVSF